MYKWLVRNILSLNISETNFMDLIAHSCLILKNTIFEHNCKSNDCHNKQAITWVENINYLGIYSNEIKTERTQKLY